MRPLRLPPVLDVVDARVETVVRVPHGTLPDHLAHAFSAAADRSRLWVTLAALRFLRARPGDRVAAARMVLVVGVESAVVHGLVKRLFARGRPPSEVVLRFGARRPPSSAFPSGHAASAASAAILLAEGTRAGGVLGLLAAAVAWSRVQVGLHHPTDVVAGLGIGTAVGLATRRVAPLRTTR